MEFVVLDGAYGEGGGQIVRTALAMSVITGKPVRIKRIRAKRSNPGLRPQHLKAVDALREISGAEVRGATLGSTFLEFIPGYAKKKRLRINVGTAGSVSLVLQAVIPAMAFVGGEFEVTGGTDVLWSPPVDYLREVTFFALASMGLKVGMEVIRRGYYPRGGGTVRGYVEEWTERRAVNAVGWKRLLNIGGISHATNLPEHVVRRQAEAACRTLRENLPGVPCRIGHELGRSAGPGSGITIWAETDCFRLGASSLGKKGKPAERVGEEAAIGLLSELESKACVDRFLADQLIPFMPFAGGTFRATKITEHLKTNVWVVERFLGEVFEIDEREKLVRVKKRVRL